MNEKALRILEYPKIIEQLCQYAGSPLGKELCKNLIPSTDIVQIEERQAETRDALSRIYQHGTISFSGVTDIGISLKRLEVNACLGAGELLAIARILDTVLAVKQYGNNREEDAPADCLDPLFEELLPLESLCRDIKRCILSEDEIADDASANLKSIRRTIKQTNDKLHSQLMQIVNSQNNKTMLQDSLVTMRNGRYCIPVKQEYRGQFPGMIHDQSSSGSTVFIEPMSVVNLNNELKDLAGKEQQEIERILYSLSEAASYEREVLLQNLHILKELDFIFARAAYAKSYLGTEPLFNENGQVHIKQGRHPLLDSKKVVPITISLGEEFSMLIITGPNTGGKTVSLKTVGLLTLMGQAGLHIPAFEGSRLAVFKNVFADIGDEQSIEMSLSTFSSHMTSIVNILEQADYDSLVLFDELGGGTDPIEGAALATSILNYLHERDIRCMATTHYSELKTYALSTPGIENASCEFDLTSLRPTYKLMIGIPGKSNAFAIAKKLGLSQTIIDEASTLLDSNSIDFESLLQDLEASKKTIEEEQALISSYRQEIETLKLQLQTKQEAIDSQRKELIRKAKEEAREIVAEAKEVADATIRKYNQWERNPAKANARNMEAERSKLRGRLNQLDSQLTTKTKVKKGCHKPGDFHIGDAVHVFSFDANGTVSSLPDSKGNLVVQLGILRSTVSITDVEIIDTPATLNDKPIPKSKKMNLERAAHIHPEINVIGKNVDEAVSLIDKYLDDAYMSHLTSVRIIHGKGTGALRAGIHNYLKKQRIVKDFHNAEFGQGDMGVTVVEFKS